MQRLCLGLSVLLVAVSACSGGTIDGDIPASRALASNVVMPNSSDKGEIAVYASGSSELLRKITKGINSADGMAFDSAGNLYVSNYNFSGKGSATVTVYAPGSSTVLRQIRFPREEVYDVALDSSDNLYVGTEYGKYTVAVQVFAPGASKPFRYITDGINYHPTRLRFDSQGYLYVQAGSDIEVYAPGASSPAYSVGASVDQGLFGLFAFDGLNNLYVIDGGSVYVYQAHTNNELYDIGQGLHYPDTLTLDGSGNLYVANQGPYIAVYSPGGTYPRYTISKGLQLDMTSLICDALGNLYVANNYPNPESVAVYAPGTTKPKYKIKTGKNSEPHRLILDSDGNLYVDDDRNI